MSALSTLRYLVFTPLFRSRHLEFFRRLGQPNLRIHTIFLLSRSCPWDVRRFLEYRSFTSSGAEDDIQIHLLLHVNATGKTVEAFRWAVNGPSMDFDCSGKDIFKLELLHNFTFRYSMDLENIDIRPNSHTSKWEDLAELLARGTVSALLHNEDKTAEVRRMLEDVKAANNDFGASFRWAIHAKDKDSMKLVLQCLPLPATKLKRDSRLCTNECPTINIEAVTAASDFTSKGPCRGPTPTLFSRDVEAAKKNLSAHPEALYTGINHVQPI